MQLRADRPIPTPDEPDLAREVLDAPRDRHRLQFHGLAIRNRESVYALPGEQLSGKAREHAIIEAATALDELDIDLLELEYPGSPPPAASWRTLCTARGRAVGGVPFEEFVTLIAFDEGGASGSIAGRSIWREALPLRGVELQRFLDSAAVHAWMIL